MANIFFRYGDSRNLSFVLPSFTLLGWPYRFHVFFAHRLVTKTPNILCSHARFNKKPMNLLFPKETSRYLTILRNPVDNFESVFNYMQLGKRIGLGHNPDSLKLFLNRNGVAFQTMRKLKNEWQLIRNPLLHDLGLSFKLYQNVTAVKEYIKFLENEFDLVMIMDYFDESLVLMKRLLYWNMEDILYLKLNDRKDDEKNSVLTEHDRENIKRWNKADVMLFEHFNKSLWEKIKNEGESFREELAIFRQKIREIKQACVRNETSLQRLYANKFVKGYALKSDLPEGLRILCVKMTTPENNYLNHLRKKQKDQTETTEVKLTNLTEVERELKEDEESWDLAKDLIYEPVKLV